MTLDITQVRSQFPSLASGFIFADSAGGSQTLKPVVDNITDYLLNTNVQLGADYSVSVQSTKRVSEGAVAAAKLFNASSPDEIAFSSSSTMNLENLARGLDRDIHPGDEFIITGEHEANAGPWKKLASRKGAIIKLWQPTVMNNENPYSVAFRVEDLIPLISSKTRIVAFSACSNILGSIAPIKAIVKAVRTEAAAKGSKKVEISVDCVAYAPHRRMNVQDWDVDFAVFSWYKVYGPHTSSLYIRSASLKTSISAIVHHFLHPSANAYSSAADEAEPKPSQLQPGGPGYELVYGCTAVVPYLLSLTPSHDLEASFAAIAAHEQKLVALLLGYLTEDKQFERGVRVVGNSKARGPERVPTISFVVVGQKAIKSKDVVKAFDKKGGIGIRYGHFYAYTLVDELTPKIDIENGVVRISLVHYNTVEEAHKIIEVLKEVLDD